MLIEIGQTKNGIDRLWFCCGFSLWNDKKMNNLNWRHVDIIVVSNKMQPNLILFQGGKVTKLNFNRKLILGRNR